MDEDGFRQPGVPTIFIEKKGSKSMSPSNSPCKVKEQIGNGPNYFSFPSNKLMVAPKVYICLVSTEDICPVSAADICPVSTADICPVSTEDIYPVSTEDLTAAGRRPAAVLSSVETG